MPERKPWTHDELMLAMNLYCKLPFGQLDQRNPLIREVAEKLGRTPSSLSMKLCNLASLDPRQHARGIKGLGSTSKRDREVWNEFNSDWERFGGESEEKLQALLGQAVDEEVIVSPATKKTPKKVAYYPEKQPTGPTENVVSTKVRLGQRFFRQCVLASYNCCCCITGNPVPALLVASHILPWGIYPDHRLDPRNGLCLARTQDMVFDSGLITLDEEYRLVISSHLKEYLPNEALEQSFLAFEGKQIQLPDKFAPDRGYLKKHREEVFQQ